jgi:hypothetical protein
MLTFQRIIFSGLPCTDRYYLLLHLPLYCLAFYPWISYNH